MMQFGSLLHNIAEFVYEVSIECHNFKFKTAEKKELFFATTIMLALNNNQNILSLLSEKRREELSDSIKIHSTKYLQKYSKYRELNEDAILFGTSCRGILEKLSIAGQNNVDLENAKIRILAERFDKIIKKIQLFLNNQVQNHDSIEYIHASSIVYRIKDIEFEQQGSLIDLLMLVKELWNMDYKTSEHNQLSIAEKFYLNPNNVLKISASLNAEEGFNLIINLLTSHEDSILTEFYDKHILHLYDRLKNYEGHNDIITNLLHKIHTEAQFRYSYNRLSNVGYSLLNHFQSFDAINHQIENLEFNILEAYLFKKIHFAKEVLINIAKHVDNIRVLSLDGHKDLNKIFVLINKTLYSDSKDNISDNLMLVNIQDSLSKAVHSHVKNRYSELDKFTKGVLQKKYTSLFTSLISLFEDDEDYKKILHEILIKRLASNYYLPHTSNSIDKLRIIASNKAQVIDLLSELKLLDIFLPNKFGKIGTFNFRKKSNHTELKPPIEYVKSLINDITSYCNAFQLEILYKSVIDNNEMTKAQSMLIDAIKTQIKQRMTVRKMLYSIISGRKKEYDTLKSLKKISTKHALNA